MEVGICEILIGIATLFLSLYYYFTLNFDFWKKRNVIGPKPLPIFGNFKDVILGNIHPALLLKKFYDAYENEQFIGIYSKSSPMLILKDPDIIKDVLIKDFNVFPDRGTPVNEKSDPLSQNLLNLEHARWRPLRNRLSPIFTSGKLKEMFYLMIECSNLLEKYVEKLANKGDPIECRELTAKFTTESIGVCAFGLNTNALEDEDSKFREFGRNLFKSTFKTKTRRFLRESFPRIFRYLAPYLKINAIDFFINSIKETIRFRKEKGFRRNDFVDLLMDLQTRPDKLSTFKFTDDILIAQAFVFFVAGFETSSTTMSNALYELALNPEIQDKLRKSIRDELNNGESLLSYDNIKNMKYLDKVVKETLRKYPPGSTLQRNSVAPYTFHNTKLSIPTGIKVFIPVWSIHRDPKIYPNPETFDPERFNEDQELSRHPMNYLPFGDGPHNCIGSRFANYQTKIGIATIINKFRVSVCDKTMTTYRIEPRSIIPTPIDGIHLKINTL